MSVESPTPGDVFNVTDSAKLPDTKIQSGKQRQRQTNLRLYENNHTLLKLILFYFLESVLFHLNYNQDENVTEAPVKLTTGGKYFTNTTHECTFEC